MTRLTRSLLSISARPGADSSAGDIAANAFDRFDNGASADELVIELALPPGTVEQLLRTWARLRGIVPLSPETARTLRVALRSNQPLTTGRDLIAAVRRFAGAPPALCIRCKGESADYCRTCPAKEATLAHKRSARGSRPKRSSRSEPATNVTATPDRLDIETDPLSLFCDEGTPRRIGRP
jgi:hypothetical protein